MKNNQQELAATPISKIVASDGSRDVVPFPAERDHLQLLLDVTSALAFNADLRGLVTALSSTLRRAIPHEFMGVALHEAGTDALVLQAAALRLPDGQQNGHHIRRRLPVINSPSGRAFRARRTLVFHDDELTRFAEVVAPLRQQGIRALCCRTGAPHAGVSAQVPIRRPTLGTPVGAASAFRFDAQGFLGPDPVGYVPLPLARALQFGMD